MDYKKKYLEEKIQSRKTAIQAIQLQFQILQSELNQAEEELKEHDNKNEISDTK